jgi:hypothetical protein
MYKVILTPMFPNRYKIVFKNNSGDNSTSNYFPTRELAQKECDRRNANLNREVN